MKVSSATSATPRADSPRRTGQSSDKPPLTPISAEAALKGPSDPPDPEFNAYRKDLADVALVDRVIASHYAEPVNRTLSRATILRAIPSEGGETVCELQPGERFAMLDDSVGWAWGYAGEDRRVGYVRSDALKA